MAGVQTKLGSWKPPEIDSSVLSLGFVVPTLLLNTFYATLTCRIVRMDKSVATLAFSESEERWS